MLSSVTYKSIRTEIRPGDIIAFGGVGMFSSVIKFFTRSAISHVGIVMENKMVLENSPQPGKIVYMIESTTLSKNGVKGIQVNPLSDRLAEIESMGGSAWVLFLNESIRSEVNWKTFFDTCWAERGKSYNMPAAILAGLPLPNFIQRSAKFCSQLVIYTLKKSGVSRLQKVLPASVNPQELCEMNIFSSRYYQVVGKQKEIRNFNSKTPWMMNF
jgi:hypothetical protein